MGTLARFWSLINEPPLEDRAADNVQGAVRRVFWEFFLKPHWRNVLLVLVLGSVVGGLAVYFYSWTARYIADEIVQVQLSARDAAPQAGQVDPTRLGEKRLFAVDQPRDRSGLTQRMVAAPGRSVSEKLHLLALLAVAVVLVNVLDNLGVLLVQWRKVHVGQQVRFRLRKRLYDKLHALPMSYHDRHSVGYLMTHLFSDVATIERLMMSLMREVPLNGVMILVGAAILLGLDARLACVVLLAVPAYAVCYRWFRVRLKTVNRNLREREGRLDAHVANRVRNFLLVKSFVQEKREGIRFLHRAVPLLRNYLGAELLQTGFVAVCGIVTGISIAAVLWLGALRVRDGQMTLGQLLLFYGATAAMFNPAGHLTQLAGFAHRLRAYCGKVVRVLDEPITLADPPAPAPLPRRAPEIRFEGVSLRYSPLREPALREVSFVLPAGKTLCVMGPSGSGKTTLVKLACRLYDPTEGAVRFDGIDVRGFKLADLCELVGFVGQEPLIFGGTIEDNIRYGSDQADPSAITAAARYAQIHDFINELPERYRTTTRERGLSLSGGQKQRVSLARALLYDPKVLVLDDCTSALDAETEARLVEGFDRMLSGRSAILVSHRISIAMECDLVAVLEKGRLVEFGQPWELAEAGGPFQAMRRRQLSGLRLVAPEAWA